MSKRARTELTAIGLAATAAGAAYLSAAPLWALPMAAFGAWGVTRIVASLPAGRAGSPEESRNSIQAEWDAAIADVVRASDRIRELSARAADPTVQARGAAVSAALDRVIGHLRDDPDDLLSSQRFLAVYIERTQVILARYLQLEQLHTPAAEAVRVRVRDELLPMLIQLCDAHLGRIMADDLRALETDVEVLWKSIKLEGL